MPPWGHLWFLYLLLVMYALWLGARALLSCRSTGKARLRASSIAC